MKSIDIISYFRKYFHYNLSLLVETTLHMAAMMLQPLNIEEILGPALLQDIKSATTDASDLCDLFNDSFVPPVYHYQIIHLLVTIGYAILKSYWLSSTR